MQNWLRFITLPALFLLISCSQKSLSIFFDLPAAPPEKVTQTTTSKQPIIAKQRTTNSRQVDATPFTVVQMESAKSWENAEELLPKNEMGQPDWVLALDKSIIEPRSAIGGEYTPKPVFRFDFYLKGPVPEFDAYFPHSTHTRHLDCASCHPKLFRYRGTKITMEDIDAGKYCGFCHGSVSFPPSLENCTRCHTKLAEELQ